MNRSDDNPVLDQDIVPLGFLRLHRAYHELIGLLNISQGCDEKSGLPLDYDYHALTHEQRIAEWVERCQRTDAAENMIWRVIAGDGNPRRLVVFTRRNMEQEPQKLETDAFYRHGFRRSHSIQCGIYLTYEREMPSGREINLDRLPLLVWEADWAGLKTTWQKEVLKLGDPTIAAESECMRWLQHAFDEDPARRRRRASFAEEAATHFGTRLSKRGFDRAWSKVAPEAGRDKAGAPGKSAQ